MDKPEERNQNSRLLARAWKDSKARSKIYFEKDEEGI